MLWFTQSALALEACGSNYAIQCVFATFVWIWCLKMFILKVFSETKHLNSINLRKPRFPGSFIFFVQPLIEIFQQLSLSGSWRQRWELPSSWRLKPSLPGTKSRWMKMSNKLEETQRGLHREFRGLVLCASHGWAAVLMMMLWCCFFVNHAVIRIIMLSCLYFLQKTEKHCRFRKHFRSIKIHLCCEAHFDDFDHREDYFLFGEVWRV